MMRQSRLDMLLWVDQGCAVNELSPPVADLDELERDGLLWFVDTSTAGRAQGTWHLTAKGNYELRRLEAVEEARDDAGAAMVDAADALAMAVNPTPDHATVKVDTRFLKRG